MSINKRGSRKIRIGQETYRWVVVPSGKGALVLTVQHDDSNGQLIRINIESDINDYWVEFPNIEPLNLKVINPPDVAMIITEAMKKGWTPKEKGQVLSFSLSEGTLVPHLTNGTR